MRQFVRDNVADVSLRKRRANLALLMVPEIFRTRYHITRRMHMSVLVSRAHDFMTSDNPVVWVDPVRFPPHPVYGFHFLHLSNEVVYPLTPRHCLFMSYLPLCALVEADAHAVTTVNARLARYSVNEMFALPTDSLVERARYVDDMAADDDAVRRPLFNLCRDPADGGIIRLAQVARALDVPWDQVVEENRPLVEGWRERGIDIVGLDNPVDLAREPQ